MRSRAAGAVAATAAAATAAARALSGGVVGCAVAAARGFAAGGYRHRGPTNSYAGAGVGDPTRYESFARREGGRAGRRAPQGPRRRQQRVGAVRAVPHIAFAANQPPEARAFLGALADALRTAAPRARVARATLRAEGADWEWTPSHGAYLLQLLPPAHAATFLEVATSASEGEDGELEGALFEARRMHYTALLHVCRRDAVAAAARARPKGRVAGRQSLDGNHGGDGGDGADVQEKAPRSSRLDNGGGVQGAKRVLVAMASAGFEPRIEDYNELLGCHADARDPAGAMGTLEAMLASTGTAPDEKSYVTAMHAAARAREPEGARAIFDAMVSRGNVPPAIAHYCVLINAHARGGDVEGAFAAFEELRADANVPIVNDYAYTALLKACAIAGDTTRAERVWEDFAASGLPKKAGNFNSLLNAYAKAGDATGAQSVLRRMRDEGVHPDRVTHGLLVDALWASGRRADAVALTAKLATEGSPSAGVLKRETRWTDNQRTLMLDLHSCSVAGAQARLLGWLRDELPRAIEEDGLLAEVTTVGVIHGKGVGTYEGFATVERKVKAMLEELGATRHTYSLGPRAGSLFFRRDALLNWVGSEEAQRALDSALRRRGPGVDTAEAADL